MTLQLDDIKKEFYTRYGNDGAYDLIEKAFALGWEIGYDTSKTEFTNIIKKLK